MLSRLYVIFGFLVLLGYAAASYEGWELRGTTRQQVPGARPADGGAGRSSWWVFWSGSNYSDSRSGMGGGRGGK